jgi:hypothetical protein
LREASVVSQENVDLGRCIHEYLAKGDTNAAELARAVEKA